MKTTFSILLVVTIASVNAGFLHGDHHFIPAGNLVSSRTFVGGAVGGGPSAGAFSSAQYSQTVAAPATVHTVISAHPVPTYSSGYSSPSNNQNTNNNNANNNGVPYSSYGYSSGQGSNSGGNNGGNNGGQGQNPGYSQSTHYNQRYY